MGRRRRKPPMGSNGRGADCYWCKRRLEATTSTSVLRATRDHIYPKSAGGEYRVWACFTCNNRKGDMRPNEWRSYMSNNPDWWRK